MTLMWAFVAGWCGAALWHLAVMLWRRRRYVVVTRELVVKHPDVEWVEPPAPRTDSSIVGSLNGGSILIQGQHVPGFCNEGFVTIKPTRSRRQRKLSRHERALRALAGAVE